MHLLKSLPIAIYARFSSSRQDERSIDDQVRRCREFIVQHYGPDRRVEVFTDYAVSGASLDRRGFEGMMSAVESGTVAAVVTEDVSRISRDFADAAQIFKRLQYARVPLLGVADGIDTSAKHGKLTYTLKSLVADLYLDDLRDKTLRGMEGRALAGYATGTVPYGYRTRPEFDERGRELGKRIDIDKLAASIVVRMYTEFVEGRSMSWIARTLNREGIASPRARTRHRFAGWSVGSLREIFRNERYIGVWRFKTMQWVKVPGTNRRLPRKRAADEVITRQRPELQVVPLSLWESVQARLARRRGHRKQVRSRYLLSGVLHCASCAGPMTISGGSGLRNTYYQCSTHRNKGLCSNGASVRAMDLVPEVLAAIRGQISGGLVRAAMDAHNGRDCAAVQNQIDARANALADTEGQIARLVDFVANGNERFDYITERLRALELAARSQKAELEFLRGDQKRQLPQVTRQCIGAAIVAVGGATREDVPPARERLKRWLGGAPMLFGGTHVELTLVPAALIDDIARRGAIGPRTVEGGAHAVRISVAHLLAQPRTWIGAERAA
jgi:DNA invertase Pin-like site-specific DNA recombinase